MNSVALKALRPKLLAGAVAVVALVLAVVLGVTGTSWARTTTTIEEDWLDTYTDDNGETQLLYADTSWYYDAKEGTTEYEIDSAADLAGLAYLVDEAIAFNSSDYDDCTITLTQDIDVSGVKESDSEDGLVWMPIGYRLTDTDSAKYYYAFRADFDGNGHTISGMRVQTNSYSYASADDYYNGLFGYAWYATIENLNVEGSATHTYSVGGIVGYANNAHVIECTSSVDVTYNDVSTSTRYAGGVVGYLYNGSIEECETLSGTEVVVQSSAYAGGIVGQAGNSAEIIGCVNRATATQGDDGKSTEKYNNYSIGGIAGFLGSSSAIYDCHNEANLSFTPNYSGSSYGGGIAGTIYNTTVNGCENVANLSMKNVTTGGIVGKTYQSSSNRYATWEITNCRNTGNITAGLKRGGIIGYASGSNESYFNQGTVPELKWCYNTGTCYYGIGYFIISTNYKYYDIELAYALDDVYSEALLNSAEGIVEAYSVDSEGLAAAGVSLSQESESWSMNLTGYVNSSDEVQNGYPLLDWETEATVEYWNIDGTTLLVRAAFDADASLDAEAVKAAYESCGVELLPTASGSVEAGYELDLSGLSWVTEVDGTISTTHAAGASDVTYATGIWDEEAGDYSTALVEYKIDYVGLSGATTSNPTSYTVESDDIVLSDPESGSGTFLGWADVTEVGQEVSDVSGYELVEEIPSGSTGDLVLQAVWSDSDTVYIVSYNDPDGVARTALVASGCTYTAGSDVAVTVTSDCTVADPEDEPDEGYSNVGWTASYDSDGNLVLTAASGSPIEYQIVYELNEGTYPYEENPSTATVEDSIKLVSPVREGLEFWGWQVNDADGDYVTYLDSDTLLTYAEQSEDGTTWTLTLFASWPVYSIEYNGLDDGYAFNSLSNPDTYTAGEEVTLYDAEKYGYEFTGWYDNEDLEGDPVTSISSDERGTVELWAGWEIITYTVTVDLNDDDEYDISASSSYEGGLPDGSDGFTYDATTEDIIIEDAERDGFDFKGWKDEDGKSVYMIFGGGLTHEDMNLTASWSMKTYTVTYVLNGGTVSGGTSGWLSSYNVTTSEVSLSDYAEPTRDGYEFAGWYLYETDEDGNTTLGDTKVTSLAGGSTGDMILGAKWEGVPYSVTYNLNGGNWGDAEPEETYYTEDGLELLEPIRDGYDFAGWYDNENLDGDPLTSIEAGATGDVELWASWTEQEEEEAAAVTVQATESGAVVTATLDSEFANAEVVDLTTTLSDGSEYTTSAVVAEHTIEFYAEESGAYTVTQSTYPTSYGYDGFDGMDVWSNMDMLATDRYIANLEHTAGRSVTAPIISSNDEEGGLSLENGGNNVSNGSALFVPYKGVDKDDAEEKSYGSEEDPIAVLVHLVGVGDNASGALELTRPAQDGLLGYISGNSLAYEVATNIELGESPLDQETDYQPTYLVAEDRDEDTGRLLASVSFEPSEESSPSNYAEGGQNSFNLVLDPTEDLLAGRLSEHSDYADGTYDAETDASEIAEAESEDGLMVLANLDSMVAYTTGGKTYTLDIATLSDGEFEAGDDLVLEFLAASGDDDAYANDPPSFYEDKLQDTEEEITVDSDGYIEFTLYGGGVYTLSLDDEESEAAVEELASSITWVTEDDDSDSATSTGSGDSSGASTDVDSGSSASSSGSGSNSESDSNSSKTKTKTKTIVKTIVQTVTKKVPVYLASSGSSDDDDDSTGISLDVDTDADNDKAEAKSGDSEEIEESAGQVTDEGDAGSGDEAGEGGQAEYNKFFQDGDGNIIWWRIILLFILIFLILAILFFILGWLLHRRKKQKEEDEEEDAADAAAMAAGSSASSGLGSAATNAAMSSEAATQVAVEAARKAAEEAAKK